MGSSRPALHPSRCQEKRALRIRSAPCELGQSLSINQLDLRVGELRFKCRSQERGQSDFPMEKIQAMEGARTALDGSIKVRPPSLRKASKTTPPKAQSGDPAGTRGFVVWFTGFSASGKSALAAALADRLRAMDQACCILDGDVMRRALSSDLGFSRNDRRENIRRAGAVAEILAGTGLICVVSFISPYREDRERIRQQLGAARFVEVFVNAPIELCEKRDPKGLYKKARSGLIPNFTGISDPYEAPLEPDVEVRTGEMTIAEGVETIVQSEAFCRLLGIRNPRLSG